MTPQISESMSRRPRDLASRRHGPKTLERTINEADKLEVVDADSLRWALGDHSGEPGIRLLRHVLDKHTFRLSDDELERPFRQHAACRPR
jgi:hypothetical protein